MNAIKRLGLTLAGIVLWTHTLLSFAQTTPSLTGPRIVTLPYVYVPFIRSETVIRQGKKDPSTGSCAFTIDLKIEPGALQPGEKLASIQRAYDPDTCEELLETGVILSSKPTSQGTDPDGELKARGVLSKG